MDPKVEFIFSIVLNAVLVINIILFLELFFGISLCKKKSQYAMIGIVFIVMNMMIALIFKDNPWIQTIAIYCYMVICGFLLSKEKFIKVAFFTLVAIVLDIQWTSILELISKLLGLDVYTIVVDGDTDSITYYFLDIILFLLLIFFVGFTKRKKKQIQLSIGEAVFLFFFCIFSPMIIMIFQVLEDTFQNYLYTLSWMFFVILLNVAVFYGIIYRNHAKYYKNLSENFKEQFNSEYAYFKDYKETQKDMVKFRHDYRNHMLLLESMLEKGEYEKAKDYFNQLSERGEKIGKKILTGNEIVDMLFNAKQEQFIENNIQIICNGGLEPLKFMEDVDCCILFSNLIDNAIEANRKCQQKPHLTIKSTQKQGVFMVELSNRTEEKLEREGNFLKTTKEHKEKHGIGTRNAFEIIEKYQGEYRFFIREHDFVMQMIFYTDRLSQSECH